MPHAPSYLLKNSFGIYHLRLAVPKHLRYIISKREIKKTLRTGNHREALRKARRLATILQDKFDEMTLSDDPYGKGLIIENFKRSADGSVEIKGVHMDPNHPEAEQAALDKILGHNNQQQTTRTNSMPLLELINEYLEAMTEDCNSKTLSGYKSQLDTFLEILGDIPIADITRKHARQAVSILKQLPPNRNKLKEFRELSIAAIIQLKPVKVLSPTTVKLHIERISALFAFAIAEQHTDSNPFTKLTSKNSRRPDQERKQFTDNDIAALFSPDNCKSDPGRPSRSWIPIIAALSGLRLEEIAQLDPSDIKKFDGVYCFDINDDGNKKLKNLTANRIVPIHSKLLENHFLLYVNGQKGLRLFPDLTMANGKLGHHFSKWFARHRKKSGVVTPGKTFHSFRHSVATQFKQADIDVTKAAAILGHTVNGETYGRYGKAYTPAQLQEVIEVIDYGNAIP